MMINSYFETIITIICTVIASSGFWAFISSKSKRKVAVEEMLRGLGHDRILFLGMHYIERGYITKEEYENLVDYLYSPYEALGGNGSAKRVIEEIKKLEIRSK